MSLSYTVSKLILEGEPEGRQLDQTKTIQSVASQTMKSLPVSTANLLEMDTGDSIAAEYEQLRGFNFNFGIEAFTAEADTAFITPIVTKISADLPSLTTNLWKEDDAKEAQHKINATLKEHLETSSMDDATAEVQAALDAEDQETAVEMINTIIDKRVKNLMDKQMAKLKRQERKNSSGEDKNQTSKPKKNGQDSKKKSNSSAPKKDGKKEQAAPKKDNKASSSSKKKKGKANSKNNNNRPQKQQDSAGGSNGGGKRKGAARR